MAHQHIIGHFSAMGRIRKTVVKCFEAVMKYIRIVIRTMAA